MFLYNLTLSRASGIQKAIYGNFSAPKAQEVVVSRGKVLELLRPDESGKMQIIVSTEIFGTIRALLPFRLTGANRDYIVIGSDSGRIVILEYSKEKNMFVKVHQETFGKSGARRIVPGEYLAVDPKGRACMIGAVEKQKLVYVLNRDSAAHLTISSPLEAHKSHNIVFDICGLDCGFDNPVFAAIELDYSDADLDPSGEAASQAQKHLTYYELDLGLNHVLRKWSEPIDNGGNLLVAVPGGGDGPGGVLVAADNFVIYRDQEHEEVRAVIPRRSSLPGDRGVLIVCNATHKTRKGFFFLLQSEYGDIYKVSLVYHEETVSEVKVKYFDTLPPCSSICVLKTGFLFAASEFGNHSLYQFSAIGEEADVESSSADTVATEEGYQPIFFDPRGLKNLLLVDEMESLCPIMDMQASNLLAEEIPQIYTVCGRGSRSSLRILRPGLAITELAKWPLPGQPTAVWTLRRSQADELDALIVVSFANATLVLAIGETVEEVNDSGFLGNVPTLTCQLMADDSMLQIHAGGLRHIKADKRVNEWRVPGRRTITCATTNERQVAIALSGAEVNYFELDAMGQLAEMEKKEMECEVAAMDVGPVPPARQRSRFLAVGSVDSTIRLLSLDPADTMKVLAVQQTPAMPSSCLFLDSPAAGSAGGDEGAGAGALFLHIGLSNGVLLRTEVDHVTGQLSDTRTRFLGTLPPKLLGTTVAGRRSMLALSSRPWLGYSDQGRHNLSPLSFEALDYASSFASEQCPEGFVAVAKSSLRILTLERLGEVFNQSTVPLRYTPRGFALDPINKVVYVAEADHAVIPLAERTDLPAPMEHSVPNGPEQDEELAGQEQQFGGPRGSAGQWASCVRIVDPATAETVSAVELDDNEGATCVSLVRFDTAGYAGTYLAVGTAQGLSFNPRQADGGFVRIYSIGEGGRSLELLHKTRVEGIVGALAAFRGRLLVGLETTLRLYDLGKKKLLRKCEHRKLPSFVTSIQVMGERIFVGDLQESFHYMRYKRAENSLYIYADDIVPRHVTAGLLMDYDTMAGGDKFGNLFMTRLPADTSAEVEDDPTGGKFSAAGGSLNSAAHKLQDAVHFHVGDIVKALSRATLQPGGQEALLYGTLTGAIGAVLPFTSREDVDFFLHLEMHLRQDHPPLCGRDHLSYRSAYFPVKDVIDGDLCEQFAQLSGEKQRVVAEELERTPGEVLKKLEDIRNKIM